MSPEQCDGKLTFKCDIWSFGCVLLQFATAVAPYQGIDNDLALCHNIARGKNPLEHARENHKDQM
jgi:serine/threonine protein kinase